MEKIIVLKSKGIQQRFANIIKANAKKYDCEILSFKNYEKNTRQGVSCSYVIERLNNLEIKGTENNLNELNKYACRICGMLSLK